MGNSVVKDFKQVTLGHGSMPPLTNLMEQQEGMIASKTTILDRPLTILVRRDYQRKSTIYFDQSSMTPLYLTFTKLRHGHEITITKDARGRPLFLTTTTSTTATAGRRSTKQNKRKLIFRAPQDLYRAAGGGSSTTSSSSTHKKSGSGSAKRRNSTGGSSSSCPSHYSNSNYSDYSDHSSGDTSESSSASHSYSRFCQPGYNHAAAANQDVSCAAQIDLDRSGAAICAFLSVVVWNGEGPVLRTVYKAVKIPQVKYGALVMDMMGVVVGKAFIDEQRLQPIIQVAAGADLASVVALASASLGDL
ncbi:hypothetical protein ACA910_007499 [Epithemia clementina (nom. ined.)]